MCFKIAHTENWKKKKHPPKSSSVCPSQCLLVSHVFLCPTVQALKACWLGLTDWSHNACFIGHSLDKSQSNLGQLGLLCVFCVSAVRWRAQSCCILHLRKWIQLSVTPVTTIFYGSLPICAWLHKWLGLWSGRHHSECLGAVLGMFRMLLCRVQFSLWVLRNRGCRALQLWQTGNDHPF